MNFFIIKLISTLILPPGLFLIIIAIIFLFLLQMKQGYSFYKYNKRSIYILLSILFLFIYILSSYPGELLLVKTLEEKFNPIDNSKISNNTKSIIVILGGGIIRGTPRGEEIAKTTLIRLYHGFNLWQETGYDIIVSGGIAPGVTGNAEAILMKEILTNWGIDSERILVEDRSLTTWENAINTIPLLERRDYKRIILVTSATHILRALYSFKKEWKNELIAAPADYKIGREINFLSFLPNKNSLDRNLRAVHEWVGLTWYWIRDLKN